MFDQGLEESGFTLIDTLMSAVDKPVFFSVIFAVLAFSWPFFPSFNVAFIV